MNAPHHHIKPLQPTAEMADDCPVCYDKFTAQVRKPVECPYCDFAACNVCSKKYLTDGILDAHCMSCKRAWNDEFLDLNFTKAFRTGPWKKHREKVLMERELSILPTRQLRVEATFKMREQEKKMAEFEVEQAKLNERKHQIERLRIRYEAESQGRPPPAWTLDAKGKKEIEKTKFVMKCPDAECRGFLSTAYKCGTCQRYACSDCLEIKGKDKDTEHTCSEERKASVTLILKESRACPKCGERISKIDGCSQMFCTECHAAFDWNTGQLVNGVIHNPHYYEFLRKQGNGVAPRNAGDVPCGGVPTYYQLEHASRYMTGNQKTMLRAIHRVTAEIQDYELRRFQGNFNVEDNGDLGVKYLMREIEKEEMQKELVKRETKRLKHLAIRAVLELFLNTSIMMLNNLASHPPKSDEAQQIFEEFVNLKHYVNDSLLQVSRMKSCSVPQIGRNNEALNWHWSAFNKAAPKSKKVVASTAVVAQPAVLASDSESDSEVESVS